MRIAVGGFLHESHSFAPRPTTYADFVHPGDWKIRFLGFIREANVSNARKAVLDLDGVAFVALEEATFDWKYWTPRLSDGLPR